MQWFRNRKIGAKLMLSFGVLALLIGGVGYLGIRGMAQIQDALRDLHQNDALGVMYLEQANTQYAQSGRSVLRMQTATDQTEWQAGQQRLLTHRKQFEERFEMYRKTLTTEEAKIMAAEVWSTWRTMCAKQDESVDLLHHNQRQQALAILAVLASEQAKGDEVMGELSKRKEARMQAAAATAESAFSTTRRATIAIVLAAIGLAIGLGIFVARMISEPLARMVAVAQKLAAGDMNQKIE